MGTIPQDIKALSLIIEDIVKVSQGIKGVELAVKFIEKSHPHTIEQDVYNLALSEAIRVGGIIEITYVLPEMNYREKSFYLPKGTRIEIQK